MGGEVVTASASRLRSMPTPRSKLAKLTRPTLNRIQARPRLFEKLRPRRGYPIVWVSSPPGYGKTSLAVSYLEHERPATEVWLQVDADDSDAATLFYHLSMAAADIDAHWPELPLLIGELVTDYRRFSRAFFRQFFARLTPPATVVFDNLQELAGDGLAALAAGLGEVPEGVTVLVLSREAPPPALARLQAQRRIGYVDCGDLRFTDAEAVALAGGRAEVVGQIRKLLPRLQGWAAGISLTLEHLYLHGHPDGGGLAPSADRDTLFRYFAGEVFQQASAETQHVLLACALLPSVSAAHACALADDAAAGQVMDMLYRRRMFVDRRGDSEPIYHFHALFHEFLRSEVERRCSAEALRALAARSARLLAADERTEEAALLFRQAEDWPGLADLLASQAGTMVRHGRAAIWHAWLGWLPEEQRRVHTWLLYWDGVGQLYLSPELAKDALERAHRAFTGAEGARGRLLAAAELVLFHHYERFDYCSLPRWVEAIRQDIDLLDAHPSLLSPEEKLRIESALLIGLLFHQPDDPLLQRFVAQVRVGLGSVADANEKIAAGTILLQYLNQGEGGRYAEDLIALLEPVARDPQVSPFNRICWQARLAFNQYLHNEFAASQATTATARASAEMYGLSRLVLLLDGNSVAVQLACGQLDTVRAELDRIRQALSPRRRLDAMDFSYLEISLQLRRQDTKGLLERAAGLLEMAREVGMPTTHLATFMALRAVCHLVAQEFDCAQHWFDRATAAASRRNAERHAVLAHFAHAYRLLRTGCDAEAGQVLAQAFSDHKRLRWIPLLGTLHDVLGTLCAAALEAGVETDHVREIVAARKLLPPHPYLPHWPWAIRLRLLGKPSLALAGEDMLVKGKVQKRPLEVLAALVASRRGEVDAIWLRDRLWPDADGAAARTALDAALHRLRKLLRCDGVVNLRGGHVILDRAALWSDVWALQGLAQEIAGIGQQTPPWQVLKLQAHLFELYRGPFCGEDPAVWAMAARDLCRDTFVNAVVTLGTYWDQRREWCRGAALHSQALEIDDLAEPFYQGLIRCATACNDAVSALAAYRRCVKVLAQALGIPPSAGTRRLMGSLLAAAEPG